MREFLRGIGDYSRAHKLIVRENLWWMVIIPGVISLLYFPVVIWGGFYFYPEFTSYMNRWVPDFLESSVTTFLLSVVFLGGAFVIGFLLFRNIIIVLYSPVLGYLSEVVERKAYGREAPAFSLKGVCYDVFRAILISSIAFVVSMTLLIFCWLLVFIPVVGAVLSGVSMSVVQMFFAGIGFADPTLERRRLTVRDSFGFSLRNRYRLIGNGAVFMGLVSIPILGWFLAPGYGIVAATLSAADLLNREEEELVV